jgi:diguanylate cyclase (GGDEF)-like protein
MRLFAALAVALALVGFVAYELISDRLEQHQIEVLAGEQQADAAGADQVFSESPSRAIAVREIDEVLEAVGRRPGTTEASLIGPEGVIIASNHDGLVGEGDPEEQITAALEEGKSRYGREVDQGEPGSDFEFVTPIDASGESYALETSFDSESFDGQVADIRQALLLIGVIALFGVGGLFYVLGGRALLRSHSIALERATRDGLTELPNQRAFHSDLKQAVASAERQRQPLALATFDIDHFKLINDRHGHIEGDAALQRVADVLRQGRSADRGYRIGGDEFALILPHADVEGAEALTTRLCKQLKKADVDASIGVSVMRASEPAGQLREEADAAAYEAKRLGGGRAVQFEQIRETTSVITAVKRDAAERLIEEGMLRMVFQPIWGFTPARMIGMEALMRPDPALGFTGPTEVFDVADHLGRVPELDMLCARKALRAFRHISPPDPRTPLFLNLAPRTLEQHAARADYLRDMAAEVGLQPEQVVVEVTERIGARTTKVVEALQRLREAGFRLALDDVGTGNAGLEMLHKVAADFVKLDRSIVAAAPTEPNARGVLMAMATYAAQTGAFVIAEGVEDEDTLTFLRRIEEFTEAPGAIIQGAQGFGLGRPARGVPTGIPPSLAAAAEDAEFSVR